MPKRRLLIGECQRSQNRVARICVLLNTVYKMSITPAAIQQLLDELESSKRARQRAWEVLQELREVLSSLGNIKIEAPAKRTFDAEGAILKRVLSDCLRDRHTDLAPLAYS